MWSSPPSPRLFSAHLYGYLRLFCPSAQDPGQIPVARRPPLAAPLPAKPFVSMSQAISCHPSGLSLLLPLDHLQLPPLRVQLLQQRPHQTMSRAKNSASLHYPTSTPGTSKEGGMVPANLWQLERTDVTLSASIHRDFYDVALKIFFLIEASFTCNKMH